MYPISQSCILASRYITLPNRTSVKLYYSTSVGLMVVHQIKTAQSPIIIQPDSPTIKYLSMRHRLQAAGGINRKTIRSELEKIPEYTHHNTTHRHESFYLQNSKKTRLEQQRNTEIQRNNRLLYEKIRTIMKKGRFQSEQKTTNSTPALDRLHRSNNSSPPATNRFMLTFIKAAELPPLTPIVEKKTKKSNLSNILEHRQKFIDGYFESIKATRENMKNKRVQEQLEPVIVGKWKVQGVIYEEVVILRGKDTTSNKQITKKYPYPKVMMKLRADYKGWVTGKFEFQV